MEKLTIYKEEKSNLSEVDFVKDTYNQVAIRKIDSYEFTKQFGMLITTICAKMGIKHEISQIYKSDIKEMILSRFKNLSLNEIDFAFKLERYGNYVDEKGQISRTEHFHDFNTVYISTILTKYIDWKRKTKLDHNITRIEPKPEITQKEKDFWISKGVLECFDYFLEHRLIMDGKIYVYDILYDMGLLPTDPEYKKKVYAEAVEVIEFEYSNKKAVSLDDKKNIREVLEEITKPKSGKAITKAKELVLLRYFREVSANEDSIDEFKNRF